jgi:hypothetical protein
LPRKESFYNSKLARTPQFYPDSGSDRLQDAPPVRPLRDTDLTGGVSLIGLVPIFGANRDNKATPRCKQLL